MVANGEPERPGARKSSARPPTGMNGPAGSKPAGFDRESSSFACRPLHPAGKKVMLIHPNKPPPARSLLPTTSTERVNVLAHYHRAEAARMAGWRDRIDRTTNWAISVVGAMLSVSLWKP